ncbi:hypothetical protein [Luteimonas suaedae]|uniref:hypothetical protein n=1 Tax=Luteimonas suaedae TaxID=2605430 RepID=UPI0011EDBD70|nr:hypothetical protein [Luteimonas suaedae]
MQQEKPQRAQATAHSCRKVLNETVDTGETPVFISVPMTHRNTHPLTIQAAPQGVPVALAPIARLLVVVLLITLPTGAGIGFA